MLTVWVVPGARRDEIVGYHGDAVRLRVTAPPEGGRANKAVIKLLETATGLRFRMGSGATSRRKRFIAVGVDADDLVDVVRRLID